MFQRILESMRFGLLIGCLLLFLSSVAEAGEKLLQPWGYEGGAGPDHWGEMEREHEKHLQCREGQNQSPINIVNVHESNLVSLHFHYFETSIKIINNSHTMHLSYREGSYVTWGDQKYELIQFHFHRPGEHLIEGKAFEMELHLVHKTPDHQYVVIAVLFEEGEYNANNANLEIIWDKFPKKINLEFVHPEDIINASNLLPQDKEYVHYLGSLTTPPCSENVSWFVLDKALEASKDQMQNFSSYIEHNARPAQKLNYRFIVKAK